MAFVSSSIIPKQGFRQARQAMPVGWPETPGSCGFRGHIGENRRSCSPPQIWWCCPRLLAITRSPTPNTVYCKLNDSLVWASAPAFCSSGYHPPKVSRSYETSFHQSSWTRTGHIRQFIDRFRHIGHLPNALCFVGRGFCCVVADGEWCTFQNGFNDTSVDQQ